MWYVCLPICVPSCLPAPLCLFCVCTYVCLPASLPVSLPACLPAWLVACAYVCLTSPPIHTLQSHISAGLCVGACTLFATHFSRLTELAALYPNCKLWHFGVNASAQSERLDYTWKLVPGQQQSVHYGLILANAVGIPQQVSEAAIYNTKRLVADQVCSVSCPVGLFNTS